MRVLVGAVMAMLPLAGAMAAVSASRAGSTAPACPTSAGTASDYEMTILRAEVSVPRGGVVELPVCIARASGFDAPVRVRLELLPPGVDAAPLLVPAGRSSGTLRIAASRGANPRGEQDAVLVGAGYGRVHTAALRVEVTGMHDPGASDPNEDEGKTQVAAADDVISSAR